MSSDDKGSQAKLVSTRSTADMDAEMDGMYVPPPIFKRLRPHLDEASSPWIALRTWGPLTEWAERNTVAAEPQLLGWLLEERNTQYRLMKTMQPTRDTALAPYQSKAEDQKSRSGVSAVTHQPAEVPRPAAAGTQTSPLARHSQRRPDEPVVCSGRGQVPTQGPMSEGRSQYKPFTPIDSAVAENRDLPRQQTTPNQMLHDGSGAEENEWAVDGWVHVVALDDCEDWVKL